MHPLLGPARVYYRASSFQVSGIRSLSQLPISWTPKRLTHTDDAQLPTSVEFDGTKAMLRPPPLLLPEFKLLAPMNAKFMEPSKLLAESLLPSPTIAKLLPNR